MPIHNHAHHQHKRETHRIRNAEPEPQEPATVVSIVYVTAPKTFDGPIGGYKTLDDSEDAQIPATSIPAQQSPKLKDLGPTNASPTAQNADTNTRETQSTKAQSVEAEPSKTPSPVSKAEKSDSIAPVSSSFSSKATALSSKSSLNNSIAAEPHSTSTQSMLQSSSTTESLIGQSAATGSALVTPVPVPIEKSQGMTGGAKAGLAIGILICIGVLLAVVICCLRRNKKENKSYEQTDDEKAQTGNAGLGRTQSTRSTRTTATAPRLSLRPVTQFLPDLGVRRKSGNILAATSSPTQKGLSVPNETSAEKSAVSNDAANPFGNHAEVADEKNVLGIQSNTSNTSNGLVNPFTNHAATLDEPKLGSSLAPLAQAPAPLRIRTPPPEASGAAGAARTERHNAPNQYNLTPSRAASPALSGTSEYSMSSVSSGYLAHGPPPYNVHRIQLDFKPSMDDELGLHAGQLVRLLHEYDDGWALCIRLDRSQQGVAPRTCLSTRPVKPRLAADRGPALRGPPPPGMFGTPQPRPSSPASGRGSPSPYGYDPRAMSPGPRPAQRSMSPGPYGGGPQRPSLPPPGGKRRSNSASQVRDRRLSPPGPSPMNPNASNMQRLPLQFQATTAPGQLIPQQFPQGTLRKPVPGQAM